MDRPVRSVVVTFAGLWSAFGLGLVAIACAPADPGAAAPADLAVQAGVESLALSAPAAARIEFAQALAAAPGRADAAFGLALTETLLLPETDAARDLAWALGLRAPDVEEDLLGPHGVVADLARGIDRDVVRRRFLTAIGVEDGRWPALREGLVGLPPTTTPRQIAGAARSLAAELAPIASWFEAADRPGFAWVIPGGLFHLHADLVVGRGEARAIAGTVRAARAALLAVTAYGWDDTPLSALAAAAGDDAGALAAGLSAVVSSAAPPPDLVLPADELRRAVDGWQRAIAAADLDAEAGAGRPIAWAAVRDDGGAGVAEVLAAVAGALAAPTPVPDCDPPTTLSLAAAVAAPTALPSDAVSADPATGEVGLREGFAADLTAGAVAPPLSWSGAAPSPAFFASGRPRAGWLGRWLDPARARFEADLGL